MSTKNDFRWFGDSNYYFSSDLTNPSLRLVCAMLAIYLAPPLIHSIIKMLKANNQLSVAFYHYYTRIVRYLDIRIPYTSLCLMDATITFIWVLLNVAFVDPTDFPGQIGYLVVANCTFILLPIFRNSIVAQFLSIPFERSLKYHRWLGRGLLLIMTAHLAGYWNQWLREGTFATQFLILPNLFAHLAWFTSIFLTITSIGYIRRNWFEVFFYSHFTFIFFFIFGILHFPPLLPYTLPGFILYFMDRVLRHIRARPPNDEITVVTTGSITRIRGKRLGVLNFEPGQYCFVNIPQISKAQWHPVSLGSAPNDAYFSFYFKDIGSWSRSLKALHGSSPEVKIDGPYGSLSLDHTNYDVIVMCAGGIGVTPMLSVLRDLYYKISVGMEDVKKIYLFWTLRDVSMYYSFGEEMAEFMNSKISKFFSICVWITQPGDFSPLFIRGRPDWPSIFRTLRETHSDVDRIAVLTCGPPNLINTTWDCSNRFSTSAVAFDFHKETFEF